MAIDRILAAVEGQVWAMLPENLRVIAEVLASKATHGQLAQASEIEAAETRQRRATRRAGRVEIIPVMGTIAQRMNMLSASSGGASLETFAESFRAALADEEVGSILLRMDSPGGSVYGVEETGRLIAEGNKRKPVTAMLDPRAGSAAYWLAVQAGEVVVTPSGEGGGIGAYAVYFDRSEAMAKEGIKVRIIKAGDKKAEGNPWEPMDDDAAAHAQSLVDVYGRSFTASVARGRKVPLATVRESFGQGRMFDAARMVKLGMADRIVSFDDLLDELQEGGAKGRSMVALVSGEERHAAWAEEAAVAASVEPITQAATLALMALTDSSLATTTTAGAIWVSALPSITAAAPASMPAPAPTPLPAPQATEESMDAPSTAAQNGAGNATAERERQRQIRAIAATHQIDRAKADAWCDSDTTVPEVNAAVLAELQAKTKASVPVRVTGQRERAEDDPRRGFRSHRDFFLTVMDNSGLRDVSMVRDERLRPLALLDKDDKQAPGELAFVLPHAFTPAGIMATVGSDEQAGYADRYGGFAVPTTLLPGMKTVPFEGDPTVGRTQSVPMATPSVDILARVDKDHSTSVSGGFVVTRRPEAVLIASSRMEMELIHLRATGLFGLAFATEEILADSPISFAALIASGFADQFPAHILNEKIRGTGAGEMLGVLNSPAKIEVAKETGQAADTIVSNNIINMASRCWGFGDAIWLANHDTRPQLAILSIAIGTGGTLIYQPAQQERFPDMLWGRPLFYTEYASTIGDVGDIILCDWSQYLEGLYEPMQSAESIHVRFLYHERAFKFWLRNDGAPWWSSVLTPAKSAVTMSPIVTLAARA